MNQLKPGSSLRSVLVICFRRSGRHTKGTGSAPDPEWTPPCVRARCARTAPQRRRSRPAPERRAPADPASSGPSAARRESRGPARWRYDGHLVGSTAPPHLVIEAHRKGAIGVLLIIRHHHTAPTAGAKCVDDVSAGIGQRAPPRAHRTPSRPGSGSSKSSARTSAQRPWRRHTARDSDGSSVGRISRS